MGREREAIRGRGEGSSRSDGQQREPSNQVPVAGGCGFGLRLSVAATEAYPIGRVTRVGGIGGVAKPLDIPSVVALHDSDIADLRGARAHPTLLIRCRSGVELTDDAGPVGNSSANLSPLPRRPL
jgi:hypothetical protein